MSERELQWQSLGFDALDSHQLYRILHLRQRVFIVEQNCIYQDLDNLDQLSLHLCANRGGTCSASRPSPSPMMRMASPT